MPRRRPTTRAAVPPIAVSAAITTALAGAVILGAGATAAAAPATSAASGAGTVFATTSLANNRLVTGAGSGNGFTYWTVGADKKPQLSAGTVEVPAGHAPAGGWPVVVWAHGIRGIADGCAPSVHPSAVDTETARRWLDRGYAVVTPDYAGFGSPGTPEYFDTTATARNIVDAVRAAHDVTAGLAKRWTVLGETLGAAAAIDLARDGTHLQGPTLDYRGSATSSVPVEFDTLMGSIGPSSTAMPAGVTAEVLYTLGALRNARPSIGLDSYLTDTGRDWLAAASSRCADDLIPRLEGVALGPLFRKPLSDNKELMETVSASRTIPLRGFNRPLLLTQSLFDQNVIVPLSLRYLNDARAADSHVTSRTYVTMNAQQSDALSDSDIHGFVDRVMAR